MITLESLIRGGKIPTLFMFRDIISPNILLSKIFFNFIIAGLNLSICPTIKIKSLFWVALIISNAESSLSAIGFSINISISLLATLRANFLCRDVGTQIETASIFSLLNILLKSL